MSDQAPGVGDIEDIRNYLRSWGRFGPTGFMRIPVDDLTDEQVREVAWEVVNKEPGYCHMERHNVKGVG